MTSTFIVHCPKCGAKNRIPRERWGQSAVCGKCRNPLLPKGAFPDGTIIVSDRHFKDEVIEFPGPVALEFYSPTCGYSQRLAPIMEELSGQYAGRVKFTRMDITTNRQVPSQFQITGTPTLIFFSSGRLVNRVNGFVSKSEIEDRLNYLAG